MPVESVLLMVLPFASHVGVTLRSCASLNRTCNSCRCPFGRVICVRRLSAS